MLELQIDALGPRALRVFGPLDRSTEVIEGTSLWPAYVPGRLGQFLYARAATLYGGTREVQKNIIARRAFGL